MQAMHSGIALKKLQAKSLSLPSKLLTPSVHWTPHSSPWTKVKRSRYVWTKEIFRRTKDDLWKGKTRSQISASGSWLKTSCLKLMRQKKCTRCFKMYRPRHPPRHLHFPANVRSWEVLYIYIYNVTSKTSILATIDLKWSSGSTGSAGSAGSSSDFFLLFRFFFFLAFPFSWRIAGVHNHKITCIRYDNLMELNSSTTQGPQSRNPLKVLQPGRIGMQEVLK